MEAKADDALSTISKLPDELQKTEAKAAAFWRCHMTGKHQWFADLSPGDKDDWWLLVSRGDFMDWYRNWIDEEGKRRSEPLDSEIVLPPGYPGKRPREQYCVPEVDPNIHLHHAAFVLIAPEERVAFLRWWDAFSYGITCMSAGDIVARWEQYKTNGAAPVALAGPPTSEVLEDERRSFLGRLALPFWLPQFEYVFREVGETDEEIYCGWIATCVKNDIFDMERPPTAIAVLRAWYASDEFEAIQEGAGLKQTLPIK